MMVHGAKACRIFFGKKIHRKPALEQKVKKVWLVLLVSKDLAGNPTIHYPHNPWTPHGWVFASSCPGDSESESGSDDSDGEEREKQINLSNRDTLKKQIDFGEWSLNKNHIIQSSIVFPKSVKPPAFGVFHGFCVQDSDEEPSLAHRLSAAFSSAQLTGNAAWSPERIPAWVWFDNGAFARFPYTQNMNPEWWNDWND